MVVSESQLVITWRYEYDRSILICDKPGGYRGGIVNLAFMISWRGECGIKSQEINEECSPEMLWYGVCGFQPRI